MFEALKKRLADMQSAPTRALPRAAARIEAKLRADASKQSGKIPAGISAIATSDAIVISASARCLAIAIENGEPEEWLAIVADEIDLTIGR